jgi:hypothetical protein
MVHCRGLIYEIVPFEGYYYYFDSMCMPWFVLLLTKQTKTRTHPESNDGYNRVDEVGN